MPTVIEEKTSAWPPVVGTIYRNRPSKESKWNTYRVENLVQNSTFQLGNGSYHCEYTFTPVETEQRILFSKKNHLPQDFTALTYAEWEDYRDMTDAEKFPQSVIDFLGLKIQQEWNNRKLANQKILLDQWLRGEKE